MLSQIENKSSQWILSLEYIVNNLSQNDIILYFQPYSYLRECTLFLERSSKSYFRFIFFIRDKGILIGFGFISGVNNQSKRAILLNERHVVKGVSLKCKEGGCEGTVKVGDMMYQSEKNKLLIIHNAALRCTPIDLMNAFKAYGEIRQVLLVKEGELSCCWLLFDNENTVERIINEMKQFWFVGNRVELECRVIQGDLKGMFNGLYEKSINHHCALDKGLKEEKFGEENCNSSSTDKTKPKAKKLLISQIFNPEVLSRQINECRSKRLNYQFLRKQLEESSSNSNGYDNSFLYSLLAYLENLNPANPNISSPYSTPNGTYSNAVQMASTKENKPKSNNNNLKSRKMNTIEELNTSITTGGSHDTGTIQIPQMPNSHATVNPKKLNHKEEKLFPKMHNYFKYKLFDSYGEKIQKVSIGTSEERTNCGNSQPILYQNNNCQYQQLHQPTLPKENYNNCSYDNGNGVPYDGFKKEPFYLYQSRMFKPRKRLIKTYCPY